MYVIRPHLQVNVDDVLTGWLWNGHVGSRLGGTRHLMEQLPGVTIRFPLRPLNVVVVLWKILLLLLHSRTQAGVAPSIGSINFRSAMHTDLTAELLPLLE